MDQKTKTLAQVVGENVKRLRGNKSMETIAHTGHYYGLSWSAGSISAIEKGDFKVTIETLLALTAVLGYGEIREDNPPPSSWHTNQAISLHELLKTDSLIEITEEAVTTSSELTKWLEGKALHAQPNPSWVRQLFAPVNTPHTGKDLQLNLPPSVDYSTRPPWSSPTTPGEERAAKSANIHVYELMAWSEFLWGTRFETKRDQEAGEGATPQKKGRITRTLVAQIQEAMNNDGKR